MYGRRSSDAMAVRDYVLAATGAFSKVTLVSLTLSDWLPYSNRTFSAGRWTLHECVAPAAPSLGTRPQIQIVVSPLHSRLHRSYTHLQVCYRRAEAGQAVHTPQAQD